MSNYLVIFLIFLISNDTCVSKSQSNKGFLDIMANTLNKSIPKYKRRYDKKGFYIENNQPRNFFVFNLVNTENNSFQAANNEIVFKNKGIYHFAPIKLEFSFSHIAIINEGEMKVFSYINCDNKGDNINTVLEYVKSNFDYEDSVLSRIKNYRKHGIYFKTDPQSFSFKCE